MTAEGVSPGRDESKSNGRTVKDKGPNIQKTPDAGNRKERSRQMMARAGDDGVTGMGHGQFIWGEGGGGV
jgi:hypothetical protein